MHPCQGPQRARGPEKCSTAPFTRHPSTSLSGLNIQGSSPGDAYRGPICLGQMANRVTGGRLQPVLMRPTPQLSFKTRGGGEQLGGGGPAGGRGGGVPPGGRGGGCSCRGSGGGLAGGHGGVQPGVRGGGVRVRVKVRVRVSPRVRVRVTELVEPVLVL